MLFKQKYNSAGCVPSLVKGENYFLSLDTKIQNEEHIKLMILLFFADK